MGLQNIDNVCINDFLKQIISEFVSREKRKCPGFSDDDFILIALQRVIEQHSSGREYLQALKEIHDKFIHRSTFFRALGSARRVKMFSEFTKFFYKKLSSKHNSFNTDYLSDYPELNNYDIFSYDGHFIEHACHTLKNKNGKVFAAGNIFGLNMRNGLIELLAPVSDGSNKKHEMPIFRKNSKKNKTKRSVIEVCDRAYIDHRYWNKAKANNYFFITRKKSNIALIWGGVNTFDSSDPVNVGIVSDKIGYFNNSNSMVRVIEFVDPESNKAYTFMTTLGNEIRPGIIAKLYFHRWGIEKVFDNFKNSFKEKKAWATGIRAIENQGNAICVFYNFIHFLTEKIRVEKGVKDEKSIKKYSEYLAGREEDVKASKMLIHPLSYLKRKTTKISEQFIRVVRNHFFSKLAFKYLWPIFIERLQAYL